MENEEIECLFEEAERLMEHRAAFASGACFECGSTERVGTACKPCNPEMVDV